MTAQTKQTFENLSMSMRYVLPCLMALFMYNYRNDQNTLHQNVQEIKEGQKAVWLKIDNVQTKERDDYDELLKRFMNRGNINP